MIALFPRFIAARALGIALGLTVMSGLMPSARWLAKSYLDNPGAWRRQVWSKVLPDGVPPQATALLVRRNGDVVLGSAKGLAVWRRGFWEWFGWDAQARHFSSEASPHAGGAWPVTALAEDARGPKPMPGRSMTRLLPRLVIWFFTA